MLAHLVSPTDEVRELLELPMRHPRVYTTVGTRPPKGILIHGPSGSGKTSIAKAVAAETGAYFFTVDSTPATHHCDQEVT